MVGRKLSVLVLVVPMFLSSCLGIRELNEAKAYATRQNSDTAKYETEKSLELQEDAQEFEQSRRAIEDSFTLLKIWRSHPGKFNLLAGGRK